MPITGGTGAHRSGTRRLELKYDERLSNFAFNVNLWRYNVVCTVTIVTLQRNNVTSLLGELQQNFVGLDAATQVGTDGFRSTRHQT